MVANQKDMKKYGSSTVIDLFAGMERLSFVLCQAGKEGAFAPSCTYENQKICYHCSSSAIKTQHE